MKRQYGIAAAIAVGAILVTHQLAPTRVEVFNRRLKRGSQLVELKSKSFDKEGAIKFCSGNMLKAKLGAMALPRQSREGMYMMEVYEACQDLLR